MSKRIVLLFLLILISCVVKAARLESFFFEEAPGKTSVFFTFTGSLMHKPYLLNKPERMVFDFEQSNHINVNRVPLSSNSLIFRVRSGSPKPQVIRLVFDMKQLVSINATIWHPANPKQNGLRLDIVAQGHVPNTPKKALKTGMMQTSTEPSPHPTTQINRPMAKMSRVPVHVQHGPSKSLRDVIVVLDPGHGGKDPGAIGPRRNAEKNVVLTIALKLKQLIDRQPGMHAVLTRNGDYYVGLRERLNIARRDNADVFISIHADAFINQHSSGASVFALSQTGATSEAARWLAEKENYSELGGVNLSGLDDRSGVIRTVLLDLSQTATISASVQMGTQVLRHIDKVTNLHNHAVEQARFIVLKSPDTPSILVETGFISNPREEQNLTSPRYQARLTQAVFEGLKRYFLDYPPQGTRLEAMSAATQHIVRSGESLPAIAKRYHVTVAALTSLNHLPDQQIKPGQTLSIPKSWA